MAWLASEPRFPSVPISPALRWQAHMFYQHIHVVPRKELTSSYSQAKSSTDWALPGVPRQDFQNQNAELISKLAQLWKQNTHLPLVISPRLACAKKVTKHFLSFKQFSDCTEWMMEATEYPAVILLPAPFLLTRLLFLNCLTSLTSCIRAFFF